MNQAVGSDDDDDDDDDDSVVLTVRNLLGKNFLWQCEL